MRKSRLLPSLGVASLLGSSLMAGVVGAAAPAAAAGGSHPVTEPHLRTHAVAPSLLSRPAFRQELLSKARLQQRAGTAGARIAHLDPALNQVAGVAGVAGAQSGAVAVSSRGTVEVAVTGAGASSAARAVGGRIVSDHAGTAEIALKPSALRALAAQPGIDTVSRTVKAQPQVTSEGVEASGADQWQAAAPALGNSGNGVNVGIVDAGFKNLAAEESAGNLDASRIVYAGGQNHCETDQDSDHGTAVAEIVHQMAPNATLYLYCVDTNVDFSAAAAQIVKAGNIKVVNSSLGFIGESRGDGYAGTNSTELAVKAAREAGVLWIQSAGNSAEDHWTGNLVDADKDGYTDLYNSSDEGELDITALDPGTTGDVTLTWDEWPTSDLPLTLAVQAYDPSTEQTVGDPQFRTQSSGTPELDLQLSNTGKDLLYYEIFVLQDTGTPALRYDLFYGGDVYPSYLSSLTPGAQARAASGSVLTPATSPWAVAVGAAYWNGDKLEEFSSRGPTIDGRVKPDLIGYDGVSSNLSDVESTQVDDNGNPISGTTGFYGTSAAAPHVAGAAALVAAANPQLDASDIEAFLEAPNNGAGTVAPATNAAGHGLLELGAADQSKVHAAVGSRYHLLGQAVRIADTRSGLGVRKGVLGAAAEVTVPVPTSSVPADATSVVVSLSGTGAKGGTYLSLYSSTFAGNSTLNLSATDANASVTSIVKLNHTADGAINFKLRNAVAKTDAIVTLLGYFGSESDAAGDGYVALSSTRVLDTRNAIGAPTKKLTPNQSVTIDTTSAGVPSNADVAVVTVTALDQTGGGYLTAFPAASPAVSSVDYSAYPRANLVLVPVVNGKFTLQNRYATTDALVDVSGYYSTASTTRFVTLPSPVRIVDTRTGNGGRHAPMAAVASVSEDAGGLYGVPYDVSAMWVGVTAIATAPGFLSVYPNGQSYPHASNLYYTKLRSVPNSALATLSAGTSTKPPGFSTVVRSGTINLLEDDYGYFVPGAQLPPA